MSEVERIVNEFVVEKSLEEVRNIITETVRKLNGKFTHSEGKTIVCEFGSLLRSRLLGEFWVSKATLPKRLIVNLESEETGGTKITLFVQETHRYGIKLGYVNKYNEALKDLAQTIHRSLSVQNF